VKFDDDAIHGFGAPVLAVCGFSGSGKTTLLEAAISRLVERGLAIAIVKHDAHGFEVDRPGKDSDRFFRAGATVLLSGGQQQFERRGSTTMLSLEAALARLGRDHDLLLVEGHKDTPLPKFWLASGDDSDVRPDNIPKSVTNIVGTLAWNSPRLSAFMEYIDRWLPAAWNARPLISGLLMGGTSSRMGSPKQLLPFGERTLGEIAAEALAAHRNDSTGDPRVVALGQGVLPEALKSFVQLPDPPGFSGPGAALIAAHRWAPEAAWIVAACDHPWLRSEHIQWLVAQRQPGRWAIIPSQPDGHLSPTLALYEPQALEFLERQARAKCEHDVRPLALLESPHTLVLAPPAELADGWKNVNTPEELRAEELRIKSDRTREE
jgi:molybdopterin-guanine dinucleotide biosynthesis protein A